MGNGKPAISIIVPTYNVEKYITFCIDSILVQTFKDFELIIVDDVSSDATYEICQKLYADLDFVTLIKNPVNKGQWYARNMGIQKARGKYIYFMDDDDELLPEALEVLYSKAEAEQADAVHCNLYAVVYSEDRMLPRRSIWKNHRCVDTGEGLLGGSIAEKLHYQGARSMPMPWLNLFRREFLAENEIVFPEMVYGEDNIFAVDVCLKAKKFVRINKSLYLYRNYFNQKGRMVGRFPKAFDYVPIFLAGWNRIFASFTEKELPYENRRSFITSWLMAHLRFCVYDIMNSDEKDAFLDIRKNLSSLCGQGNEFTAYLVNLLEHAYGYKETIPAERAQKREAVKKLFADIARGRSNFAGDYSYIYSEARLAAYIEGGDNDFYRMVHGFWADAALNLCKYQEAMSIYDKCLSYTERGSENFWHAVASKMAILPLLNGSQDEIASAGAVYDDALSEIVPYTYEKYQGRSKKKLRLGLLLVNPASDWFALYYGLLFACDKDGFEVYCYYGAEWDGYADFISSNTAKLVDIRGLSSREIADCIHDNGIDVLIDLTENESHSFLPILSYRPAPYQITGVERLSLAGNNFIDFFLGDDVMNVGATGSETNKKLFSLPCRYSYAMRNDVSAPGNAPALSKKYITFGVFAKYKQITDDMLGLWRGILEQLPGARLLMHVDELSEESMQVEASERMTSIGYDMNRVDMEGNDGDSLNRYLDVDILLGTYPAMDSVRLLDALYMGVPVLAMYGERRDTRASLSILQKVGLEDFAVDSPERYQARALAMADDLQKLNELHKTLRGKLEDTTELRPVKWARKLETKIREMVYMRM